MVYHSPRKSYHLPQKFGRFFFLHLLCVLNINLNTVKKKTVLKKEIVGKLSPLTLKSVANTDITTTVTTSISL